jgi:CheY-like chemotaxis protein
MLFYSYMQNRKPSVSSLSRQTDGRMAPGTYPGHPALQGVAARTPTVLVIGGDPGVIKAARAALEAKGYCVPAVNDCSTGFKTIREVEPDLIILDALLMRNGKSGLQLPSEVRKDPRIAHIPILMATAANEDRTRDGAFYGDGSEMLPIDGVINKRALRRDLQRRVGMLLEMKISKWARRFSS